MASRRSSHHSQCRLLAHLGYHSLTVAAADKQRRRGSGCRQNNQCERPNHFTLLPPIGAINFDAGRD